MCCKGTRESVNVCVLMLHTYAASVCECNEERQNQEKSITPERLQRLGVYTIRDTHYQKINV